MVDVLAALHAVDPAAVGLGDFGRPEGFLERQVRRWGKQLEGSQTRDLPAGRRAAPPAHRARARRGPGDGRHRARRLPARQPARPADGRTEVDAPSSTGRWPRSATPCTDVALMLVYDQLAAITGGAAGRRRQPRRPATRRRASSSRATPRRSGRDLGDMGFHLGLASSSSRSSSRASTTATCTARPSARDSTTIGAGGRAAARRRTRRTHEGAPD